MDEEALPEIEPSRPTAITVTPSTATLSALGETTTFRARITDQNGLSFPGVVTWSSSDLAVFTVSSGGVVTAVANGAGTLTASYEGISGTASVAVRQVPGAVTVASGGGQEGQPAQVLAEPVVVRVDDAGGSPIEGVSVEFSTAEGHGEADPSMAATDSVGLAATSWTLGSEAGVQTLTASAADGVSVEVGALAGEVEPPSDTARYRIVFNATWSATTHPTDFPPGAHFSPLVGAVHNEAATFWAPGEIASPGIEQMAETGGTGSLTGEIRAEMPNNAISIVTGQGIGSPGTTTISEVVVTLEHPLITLVTMIAPSPDWFVGTSGQSIAGRVRAVGRRARGRAPPLRLRHGRRQLLPFAERGFLAQAADPEPQGGESVLGRADRHLHLHADRRGRAWGDRIVRRGPSTGRRRRS